MSHFIRNLAPAAATAALLLLAPFAASSAADVGVTVDGQSLDLNPPPIERAGRVFVPLRGIFERLGATVVYQGGVINATGNNRTVSLRIGSQQATVDGNSQTLDQAPFIIGASTYVPLRFVSQSLGAAVNYDGANRIVALTTNGMSGRRPPPPAAAENLQVFATLEPNRDSTVGATRPTIAATFLQPVDPNSLRITLDGLDITAETTRSETGIVYAPPSPLQSTQHTVEVRGRTASGSAFKRSWSFTSGTAPATNYLNVQSPSNGASVPSTFTVSGKTTPNARVHIVAGGVATVGTFAFNTGNYTGDTTADGYGNFSTSVTLQTVSGANIGLTVTTTNPSSRESAQQRLQLRAE